MGNVGSFCIVLYINWWIWCSELILLNDVCDGIGKIKCKLKLFIKWYFEGEYYGIFCCGVVYF